jgi:hypothetical protein
LRIVALIERVAQKGISEILGIYTPIKHPL